MKKDLLKFRSQLLFDIWKACKNEMTMQDIADVFNMPLKTAYRVILNEQRKKESKRKN